VWISNSYSNDGITNIQVNQRDMQILGPDAVEFNGTGRPGYDIPVALYDAVGSGTADSSTNVTDPDFEIPSEWKYALGLTYTSDDDYVMTADILVSQKNDSAIIKNLADGVVGTAPDGRPIYSNVNHSRASDFLLTNVEGNDAESTVVSFSLAKSFDNGFNFTASYAFTEAKDVHPMTSSVAFSNYHNIAVSDPENPQLSRSNYEIPHRFTLNLSYTHEFFEGYATKFNLFGQANEGTPYTYTFTSGTSGLGFNDVDRQLLYVPLVNDPKVIYGPEFDLAAFNSFIAAEGLEKYRGSIMPRNPLDSDWWVKFDIRIEQEFMGFYEDHKASAFFVIENVGNLIKDEWGVLKQGTLLQGAVEASITDDNLYSYDTFEGPTPQSIQNTGSLWEIRMGVKYKF
jgi:hypothetical protein